MSGGDGDSDGEEAMREAASRLVTLQDLPKEFKIYQYHANVAIVLVFRRHRKC